MRTPRSHAVADDPSTEEVIRKRSRYIEVISEFPPGEKKARYDDVEAGCSLLSQEDSFNVYAPSVADPPATISSLPGGSLVREVSPGNKYHTLFSPLAERREGGREKKEKGERVNREPYTPD
jgi:hypothetical protein